MNDQKRNLAFYKKSGEPWTQEEYSNIMEYVGNSYYTINRFCEKYIFSDFDGGYHMWSEQEEHSNFKNCKQVAYEDVFPENEFPKNFKCIIKPRLSNTHVGCGDIQTEGPELKDHIHIGANEHGKCTGSPIEPKHYTDMKLSPLEYITANEGEFTWCIANVIKYVSRYRRKNGLEDLKKARWYLDYQIKMLEEQ